MDLEEAKELLRKPRQGNVVHPFKRQKYMPEVRTEEPAQKRSRDEVQAPTGKNNLYKTIPNSVL